MNINNFEIISSLLKFESEDDFYFCQILKRKKEHPELGSNSLVVKTYYITSIENLEYYKDEMICLAEHHNARVGINLNRRSFKKIAFHSLRKTTDIIMNEDWKSARKAYNSVCGAYSNETEKKWIIDIDKPYNQVEFENLATGLINIDPIGYKVIAVLPTKNGYHVITKPFNVQQAGMLSFTYDIQKDNPAALYYPIK